MSTRSKPQVLYLGFYPGDRDPKVHINALLPLYDTSSSCERTDEAYFCEDDELIDDACRYIDSGNFQTIVVVDLLESQLARFEIEFAPRLMRFVHHGGLLLFTATSYAPLTIL